MRLPVHRRTAALGGVALLLVGAVVYDHFVGLDAAPARMAASAPALGDATHATGVAAGDVTGDTTDTTDTTNGRAAALAGEIGELQHFIAHAGEVRARYRTIAVPYAEAVAGFATRYAPGEPPAAAARQRLARLLPAEVRLGGLLVAETGATAKGAQWLTATLDFSSRDSAAFTAALLTLGDAANGMVWQTLTVASDPAQRTLHASGQLALLMAEQLE